MAVDADEITFGPGSGLGHMGGWRYDTDEHGEKHIVESWGPGETKQGIINRKNDGGFTNDKAFQYNENDNTIVGRHGGTRMAGDRMQKYFNKRAKGERELEKYGDSSRLQGLDQKRNKAIGKYKARRQARKDEGKQVMKLGKGFGKASPNMHTDEYKDFMTQHRAAKADGSYYEPWEGFS